jgi:hypothetical protein
MGPGWLGAYNTLVFVTRGRTAVRFPCWRAVIRLTVRATTCASFMELLVKTGGGALVGGRVAWAESGEWEVEKGGRGVEGGVEGKNRRERNEMEVEGGGRGHEKGKGQSSGSSIFPEDGNIGSSIIVKQA